MHAGHECSHTYCSCLRLFLFHVTSLTSHSGSWENWEPPPPIFLASSRRIIFLTFSLVYQNKGVPLHWLLPTQEQPEWPTKMRKLLPWDQSISRFCIYVWTIQFIGVWVHGMNKIENILDKLAQDLNVWAVSVLTGWLWGSEVWLRKHW